MDGYDRFILEMRKEIARKRIKQTDIWTRIDVSKTLLSTHLRGKGVKRGMTARAAFDIAKLLGISIDKCIYSEDE